MFKVKKDIEKNRLCITISGILSIAEAKQAKDLLIKEADELQPGFDLINDISQFIRGQEEAGEVLKEIIFAMIDRKVNRIIRVIGSSKIGLMQFANFSMPIPEYKLSYVPTMQDAEKILDKKEVDDDVKEIK